MKRLIAIGAGIVIVCTSAVTIGADRLLLNDHPRHTFIVRVEPEWCSGGDRFDPHKCWLDDTINEWRIGAEDEYGPVIK